MGLPPDVTAGPLDVERLDELADFVQRVCLAESGRAFVTREELAHGFARSHFDPGRDTLLVRDKSGALVGAEWVHSRFPFVHPQAWGFVQPGRTGEGIGTALLDWARELAESRLDEPPDGARVALQAGVDARHQPSLDLLRGFGMELTRYFLEMRIDFTGEVPAPRFPAGLDARTFRPGVDDEALAVALDDGFRDHFGYIERPLHVIMEGLGHRMEADTFDPTLWWLVREGDEVVAVNLCDPSAEGDESIGYVASLAVRRPWRGRGVAKAMLHLAFGEFRKRGKEAATLHVDAANPTGATALYESAGMSESERFAHFELEVRPGEELAVR